MSKIHRIITNGTTRRIPADEPVFLLRAQDQFAAAAVRHWANDVEANGGSSEIVAEARAHADKMDAWPTKKVPDLPRAEEMFIQVPETTIPKCEQFPDGLTVPAFNVARYLSTVVDGKATVSADAVPTVDINYYEADDACNAAGLPLLRGSQSIALAWNIYHQDENWTGGKVGEGSLYMGLHKGSVSGAQPNDYESDDPEERRWHVLSTGDRIYDYSGHLFSWVRDDIHGDEKGLVARKFPNDSPYLNVPHPSMEKGVGWYPDAGDDWSGHALVRGGGWGSVADAGVFTLGHGWPDGEYDSVGFRSTK